MSHYECKECQQRYMDCRCYADVRRRLSLRVQQRLQERLDKLVAEFNQPTETTEVHNMSHKITPTAAIVSDATRVAHLEAALKEFHTTSKSLDDALAEHHGACKPAVAAPEKTWAPAFTFKEAGTVVPVDPNDKRITLPHSNTLVNIPIGPPCSMPKGLDANEAVHSPKHYMVIGDTEACDLIACMLGQYVKDYPNATPYQIYCAGNVFKYRLRAGNKDDLQQDIDKANKYKAMHDGIN